MDKNNSINTNDKPVDENKTVDTDKNVDIDKKIDAADDYAKGMTLKPSVADIAEPVKKDTPQPKTFRSKRNVDEDNDEQPIIENKPKRRFSYAESSGIVISAVMFVYSAVKFDKPLFFVSVALLISLLKPIIGNLFGKYNQSVQNALHAFSIVMFIGALLMLFM
ncbi:MAG: hypothetical protein K6G55_05915 [Selenomonadaceae bacterium]|nr:hypothetical protein [Selenomonadaceae bacterium]